MVAAVAPMSAQAQHARPAKAAPSHLSLLPQPADDEVIDVTPPSSEPAVTEGLDFREQNRKVVALKAWVMTLSGSKRGYVADLSEGGALVKGVGTDYRVGERVLLKVMLDPKEAPVVVRAEVVRFTGTEPGFAPVKSADLALRFCDVNLDEWFRLAQFLDQHRYGRRHASSAR